MKNIVFAIACLLSPLLLFGQIQIKAKEYTHNSDYLIFNSTDLYGFPIHPKEGRLSTSPIVSTVKLNLVEFKITPSTLFAVEKVRYSTTGISSENDHKEYKLTVQQILPNSTGYEIVLMDLRNPDIQGYLKVGLDEKFQIARLQFKPSPSEPERTYILVPAPNDIVGRDNRAFTHEEDVVMDVLLDIWAKKQLIFPFIQANIQGEDIDKKRLYPSDRVKFAFEERTELKGKKEKLQQYVIFSNAGENGEEVKTEYLVKKIKEVAAQGNSNVKVVEVTLELKDSDEEMTMRIFRNNNKAIKSISLYKDNGQVIQYLMRQGKRA